MSAPTPAPSATIESRAVATLTGLAVGDALGMPTQSMPRERILARYGRLTGFEPGPADQPIAPGMPAGSVTDDTEQALLLARLLLDGRGRVDGHRLARELLAWEDDMRRRGSLDLLGPSTRAAVAAVAAGRPLEEAGRFGTTNGAAMRIAPVGVAVPATDLARLVDRVVEASWVTHNTGVALAGAAAVAAAVSAGLDGADTATATATAVRAAQLAAGRGNWVAAADIPARIAWATDLVAGRTPEAAADLIYRLVGTSVATQESVPAAFAVLAVHPDDPWQACLLAAGLGGDTDTIAAMVGAIAGAGHGVASFPDTALETIEKTNHLPLTELATRLLALRQPR
ncbi:ADP-ribosylglycohydrolase family protein [Micromonospora sp. DR5-3]|uniref:ADP-ribosylglycohydrolase family protein n=1 Tax=unclassified Micromonospora TaxID=2617518 RepID=UPI0011DBC462|nr:MULTISPECIES: ADP-ribosylglycohydrolase family protein [unclassified Micromonospora]MCW3816897.1 ADP-ribosylglycohydrolase family protein [Micromonospora sp. DR5-3]TYC23401.1 ADP-ribosylglycohydrolase family protein [Micromonospora sp. MP36]